MTKFKQLTGFLAWVALIGVPLWFLVAALGTKFGLLSMRFGFGKMTYGLGKYIMMGGAALGLLALIAALAFKPRTRKSIIVAALALVVPVLGMAHGAKIGKTAASLPFIHDVSTDTQDPPMFTDAILSLRGDSSNPADYAGKKDPRGSELVSVLQVKGYPDIRPIVLSDNPDVVFGRAQAAVKSLGWAVANENVDSGIIEATDTTFWFGFKDDVIIRIRPSEGGGSVVDIRSLSRVGGSDIGANAARIRAFREKLGS